MRSLSFTMIGIALLGLLVFTNPTINDYTAFLHQAFLTESQQHQANDLDRALGALLSGLASNLIAAQTSRKDYLLLSTYDTVLGEQHLKAIGVLKHFIALNNP